MPQRIQVGSIIAPSYELTRPSDTTAYASGDAIANSTTAASVIPMQFVMGGENGSTGNIYGSSCLTSSATAFGSIRLWLFNVQPFAAAGYQADNSALALTYAAMKTGGATTSPPSNLIGYVDFTTFTARSTSAMCIGTCPQTELPYMCGPGSSLIYGVVEAMAAFTPASAQTFNFMLDVRAQ